MDDLRLMLVHVADSYYDFVSFILHYANKKESRKKAIIAFMKKHPDATSSDIIEFVSDQEDITEESSMINAVVS